MERPSSLQAQKQNNHYAYEGQYGKQSLIEFLSEVLHFWCIQTRQHRNSQRPANIRLEIEKRERLGEKPRKAAKEIEAMGDLVTN